MSDAARLAARRRKAAPQAPRTPLLDRVRDPADLRGMTYAELEQLADELRAETVAAASETGGHFGAGLGVVEITVALHASFETPDAKLIWDVSHQAYPHKILTGRRDRIRTIRTGGGLSGFTKRSESVYDPFGAAHSSTSISAGLGFAVAAALKGEARDVVAVIGDGALSAGMAYEAISNAGALGKRLIVVLNENGMSIAPAVGAIRDHLGALSGGRPFETPRALRQADGSKASGRSLFEALGFRYVGPVDGHDMAALLAAFEACKSAEPGPIVVHCRTEKGRGYAPAEGSADRGHAVAKFDPVTGAQSKSTPKAPSYTQVFADALIAEADRDERIVAVTAAMPSGTGLDRFRKAHPDRFFDVGIAEQHGVTFCAGLAADGMAPFAAIYSTFLQRGYDQIVHDVALQKLPVRFAIDRAGLVGADGATHAGSFDIAYLANLPGFVVMAAADEAELAHMVATAAAIDDRPSALRFPRGEGVGAALPERGVPLEIGRGRIVREGTDVAILSYGARLGDALAAAETLAQEGVSATVADARFAKPLDADLIGRLARAHPALVTLEEGAVGGFGAHTLHFLANAGLLDRGLRVRSMTLPDLFIDQDSPEKMRSLAGLDAAAIARTVRSALGAD